MNRDEIPPGTLYLLILKTLALHGEQHGYEIANSIQQSSDDVLQVEEGSLYLPPADADQGLGDGGVGHQLPGIGDEARYYKLTTARPQAAMRWRSRSLSA